MKSVTEDSEKNKESVSIVEKRKKRGWIAALLNLILPGAGYFYCERYGLGIIAFLIVFFMFFGAHQNPSVWVLLFVIDGFLCARRYNKKLLQETPSTERG